MHAEDSSKTGQPPGMAFASLRGRSLASTCKQALGHLHAKTSTCIHEEERESLHLLRDARGATHRQLGKLCLSALGGLACKHLHLADKASCRIEQKLSSSGTGENRRLGKQLERKGFNKRTIVACGDVHATRNLPVDEQ
jgi:hypothetical protein